MIRNFGWAFLHHGVGRGALFVFFLALPWLMGAEDVGRLTFTYTLLLLILQPRKRLTKSFPNPAGVVASSCPKVRSKTRCF